MKTLLFTSLYLVCCFYCSALNITTEKVLGNPFCGGETVYVSYTVDAPANLGNVFTAQLSDKQGTFASPVNIGTLSAIGAGTIEAKIPFGTKTGNHYRVRVISSNPASIGTSNPNNLHINPPPSDLTVTGITACQATLNWTAPATAVSFSVRYAEVGGSYAVMNVGNVNSFTFTGLHASTDYSLQVRALCNPGSKSTWKGVVATTADCPVPSGLIVTSITTTTSSLNWNDAVCADDYEFRYRPVGVSTWNPSVFTSTSDIELTSLSPATLYEAQVATVCNGSTSEFTGSTIWETDYFRLSGDQESTGVSVFPNPSTGEFSVRFNNSAESASVQIIIQNIYGQVIYNTVSQAVAGLNETKISIDAPAGMYLVRIKSSEGELKSSLMVN